MSGSRVLSFNLTGLATCRCIKMGVNYRKVNSREPRVGILLRLGEFKKLLWYPLLFKISAMRLSNERAIFLEHWNIQSTPTLVDTRNYLPFGIKLPSTMIRTSYHDFPTGSLSGLKKRTELSTAERRYFVLFSLFSDTCIMHRNPILHESAPIFVVFANERKGILLVGTEVHLGIHSNFQIKN